MRIIANGAKPTTTTTKTKPKASWVQQVADESAQDTREQPWKVALGKTHDQGAAGEDWINLQLPNHVQCGSLAA